MPRVSTQDLSHRLGLFSTLQKGSFLTALSLSRYWASAKPLQFCVSVKSLTSFFNIIKICSYIAQMNTMTWTGILLAIPRPSSSARSLSVSDPTLRERQINQAFQGDKEMRRRGSRLSTSTLSVRPSGCETSEGHALNADISPNYNFTGQDSTCVNCRKLSLLFDNILTLRLPETTLKKERL